MSWSGDPEEFELSVEKMPVRSHNPKRANIKRIVEQKKLLLANSKMEKLYFIYIISNRKNGTLYIGMTNNLARRMYEHKDKLIEGFSKKYDVCKLVHYEVCSIIPVLPFTEKNY
jgi:putative endonuclease